MNITYIIHKIPKDGLFSLAVTVKDSSGSLDTDKKHLLLPQDKKIVEILIKDYNAHKSLKSPNLEYGKLEKVPVSFKQQSLVLTELAKVKQVLFESKKIVIDPLSTTRLFYKITHELDRATIEGSLIDLSSEFAILDLEAFWGKDEVWILHKGVLKRLKQEGKWFYALINKLEFTGRKYQDLLDHYEDGLPIDQSVPEARFIETKPPLVHLEPIILLKNERGLFFDLKFDYENKGIFGFQDVNNPFLNSAEETFWHDLMLDVGVKKNGLEYYISSPDQYKIFDNLQKQGFVIKTLNGQKLVLLQDMKATFKTYEDFLSLELECSYEDQKASLDQILSSALKKNPLLTLGDKYVGMMPLSLLGELEVLFKARRQGQKLLMQPYQKGDFCLSNLSIKDETLLNLGPLQFDTFNLKLLDFQVEGVAWLLDHLQKRQGCLLADDMGLGKTIQVLALIDLMKQAFVKGVLIVCPKSIKAQWQESIAKYLPGHTLHIEVISFSELRNTQDHLNYSLVVIDEAQGIKNAKTQIFQKCMSIAADYKIALSGTPIENSLNDLVTLFQFLFPTLVEDFQTLSPTLGHHKITRRLAPFIKRRLKKQVLTQLPELFLQECLIQMSDDQSSAYFGIIQKAKAEPCHPLALLTNLRMAALDPRLVDPDSSHMGSKTWQVLEDLEQIVQSGQKVIVFSQFTSYLKLLGSDLKDRMIDFAYLDGQTQDRPKVIKDFTDQKSILLMSLKAGGVGLNLQVADYVLLLDPWWNEAAERQAIDRAHRLGREKPVVAKRYICMGTLETKIQELKASKWALLENLEDSPKHAADKELIDLVYSLMD